MTKNKPYPLQCPNRMALFPRAIEDDTGQLHPIENNDDDITCAVEPFNHAVQ